MTNTPTNGFLVKKIQILVESSKTSQFPMGSFVEIPGLGIGEVTASEVFTNFVLFTISNIRVHDNDNAIPLLTINPNYEKRIKYDC